MHLTCCAVDVLGGLRGVAPDVAVSHATTTTATAAQTPMHHRASTTRTAVGPLAHAGSLPTSDFGARTVEQRESRRR